jgi:anti-sigma B factor antagonist
VQSVKEFQNQGLEEATVDIDIRRFGDVQVIRLRGPLTLGAPVDDLKQTMNHAIEAGDTNLVLNLSDVRWVDSSGVGVLVKSLTSAKKAGGSLKLVNPSKPALQTLKMCNLLPLFDVYAEEDQAVQSFA